MIIDDRNECINHPTRSPTYLGYVPDISYSYFAFKRPATTTNEVKDSKNLKDIVYNIVVHSTYISTLLNENNIFSVTLGLLHNKLTSYLSSIHISFYL